MAGERVRESFATLTHARLRAAQGDVPGALRVLAALLDADPDHREAARLASELVGREEAPGAPEASLPPAPPVPARPSDLAARFGAALAGSAAAPRDERIARLSAYLVTLVARRGGRRNG